MIFKEYFVNFKKLSKEEQRFIKLYFGVCGVLIGTGFGSIIRYIIGGLI